VRYRLLLCRAAATVSKFTGLDRVVDEGRWEFQIKFLGVPDIFDNRVYMLDEIEIE
jgi:hypothetical protein